MTKKDKKLFYVLAEKIASGVCTYDNLFQFVSADFYLRNKTYINRLFKYKKDKDYYESVYGKIDDKELI